ncbi:hypothetical protein [Pelagibacterium lacus]|uniref:DUF2628 domain-containing protein n=1 Tax=Pelagibacterium lacus TaxID=2282655 RepID=A0A369W904_9HYPH|nr:hypothetical protein [Pelagibacterium lacus]RDE08541.1 hypothetical protein DVH29_11040 [Pelagibacterium lacus]
MTLYAIYAKPEAGPEAIAVLSERFRWTAFLFTPLWAMFHGAIGFVLVWALLVAALAASVPLIGPAAALGLYGVFALWTGFAAARIAGRALLRRNWLALGELVAADGATAERLWLEQRFGARP